MKPNIPKDYADKPLSLFGKGPMATRNERVDLNCHVGRRTPAKVSFISYTGRPEKVVESILEATK